MHRSKAFVNSALRKVGLQLVKADTFDRLRSEVIRLREASPILEDVYGHKMHVDNSDLGLRLAPLVGVPPEASEDGFFVRNIKPGQTVVDLGANIGLYSLLFAKLVGPSGKVIAFEPGPKSFTLLNRNIQENGYENVRAENAAVTDRTGTINLYVCGTGESDNRIEGTIDPANNWERVSVPCFALDDYLKNTKVDLIKMDIQGAELAALRGMRKTLERTPSIQLTVEFSPGAIADKDEYFGLIRNAGLSIFGLDERRLSREQLLATVGNPGQPPHINILLRR